MGTKNKQMESSMGGMVRNVTCVEGSDDVVITYYKNLATTEAEGEKSPTGEKVTVPSKPWDNITASEGCIENSGMDEDWCKCAAYYEEDSCGFCIMCNKDTVENCSKVTAEDCSDWVEY